ncbi:KISc [Musa troglodytarum]|uniref:KISc n=1 Tax=Musa troglodytarum TaxID=320322 RepID=A0A9E7IDL0_9LILI|nr:KISc [Musa troglodytarum]
MDEIGISRSYRLAEKVASVVDEAQPLLAKIEALVEGVQPLLAEVRDSTLLNDVENLIKSLAEATVDLRKVQSAILTPENAELTRQSIFTLIFTLKNIEEFNQVLCQSCVRAAGAGSFRILPLRILFLNSSFRMLRDLRIFRRNSNTGKAPASEINNENLPVDPSGSSTSQLESDPSRAPLITIQEPVQNPNPGLDQGAISRRKPETTHFRSQVKGSDSSRLPFHTPEKMVSRQRFGWGLKGEPGMNDADNGDDLCYEGPSSQLPPLSRGGSICPGGGFGLITPRMYRTAAKASSVHSDCSSTQSTPTKSVTKPPSSGFSNSRPPVVIRVRPLSSTEKSLQGLHRCLKQESAHNISWIGQPETRFTFDYVACETINQEMLFRVAGLPMVENCMSGYNSCVFAYGQTGSGKTYTMLGEIGELEVRPSLNRGMTPRIFEFLFARIKAEEESRRDEKLKYSCKCSFLEIYNEQITDLLDPTSSNLLLREDIRKGVYVENLTEYVVENVNDILNLLIQGAANRKVAATNMNRESSRSHSVFTCIIESRWEKDSTVNLRFARLNLVDLAGSERQKTSGAEGERLKEAANINKSLSTLGHVIMVLADVAHGKHRHVPYRDSRLTFLLQDSLGGNSKTMIIANVSPSICSANETLSTLKFAQRARLVQNNAVVNEDASGDVISLRHQIHLLKEELSVLKRQNISRSLSFRNAIFENRTSEVCDEYVVEKLPEVAEANDDEFQTDEGVDSIRVSMKQLKSLEAILAGALRREKMADTTIKQLQAEIEQLNRLVRQREDDTQSTKMMLKFREDKIRWKIFWKARCQFQDFYKEGERELLLAEVIELRNKLMQVFDGKSQLDQHLKSDMETSTVGTPQFACSSRDNESLFVELNKTHQELKSCKSELQSCLEINERLTGEISNLRVELNNLSSANHVQHVNLKHRDIDMLELPQMDTQACEKKECLHEHMMEHAEEILNLQLELDILKTILAEEKSSFVEVEERANHTKNELKSTNGRILYMSKQYEDINNELKDARSIIEALESEHILLINEMEEARERCNQQKEILNKQEQEIFLLRNKSGLCPSEIEKQSTVQEELRNIPHGNYENEGSPLQVKLKKMQASLEKARDLNMRCQSDQVSQTSLEQEMDEVRRQVEIETAEVIVCLQEELAALQKQADGSKQNELIAKQNLIGLQTELKELHVRLHVMAEENEKLGELIEEKDRDLRSLTEDWERLACEIADILADGNMSLEEATDQVDSISDSFPKRSWIGEQIERIIKGISERDLLIEELQKCLEEAQNIRCDMEWKLRSLRGATLAITEAQQLESSDKEQEILRLTTEITEKMFTINELENGIEVQEEQIKKAELNATVAFMTVNKLSEMKPIFEIAHVKLLLDESKELKQSQEHIAELQKHSQNQERARELEQMKKEEEDVVLSVMVEDLLKAKRTINDFKARMTTQSCASVSSEQDNGHTVQSSGDYTVDSEQYITEDQMKIEAVQSVMNFEQQPVASMLCVSSEKLLTDIGHKSTCENVLEYSHDRQSNIHHLQKELGIALDQLQYVQTQMALELEVSDAKAIAAHKTIEATHLLAKIEEAQGTMQDADIMVNMLLQANETAKCDIERLQNTETMLCYEKNLLIDEIQHLQSSLHTKEKEYTSLEKNFESNLIEARGLVLELEDSCRNLQTAFAEKFESLACDLDWIKSNLQDYTESIRSCLEKTCERNVKAKEELEICSVLKGKLLVDINNSFNRIAKKEDETAEFRTRLNSFEKEILQLQSQEESMLARSNSMGTELALLVKELDDNNMNTQTALLGQDKLLKEKEVLSKELDDMTRLLHEAHRVNEMFMDSLRGELALLTDEPHPKIQMKVDVPIIILELEQNAIKCNQMASHVSKLEKENDTMSSVIEKDKICSLESLVTCIEMDLDRKEFKLEEMVYSHTVISKELEAKSEFYEIQKERTKILRSENETLKNKFLEFVSEKDEAIQMLGCSLRHGSDLALSMGVVMSRLLHEIAGLFVLIMDRMHQENFEHKKLASKFIDEIDFLENSIRSLLSENSSLRSDLIHKDEVAKGILFDLRLLQESASIAKDQEDELEQMVATMESLEDELASRSCELDEAIVLGKTLEGELIEKNDKILALELELAEKLAINSISVENFELKSHLQQVSAVKSAIQEELNGKLLVTGRLEDEILTMSTFIGERNHLIEDLQGGIAKLEEERDHLSTEVHVLKEKLDMAQALAEENEAIATEARQIAEVRKVYVEEKEEEVKLLERSVEELECTVFALENKVDIVRAEAEKHRLQREEIEIELHTMRDQLSQKNIQVLQKEIAKRDTEILQFKAHISELNMHAEAQAREYKQKFMELEAMAQQVNADPASSNSASLTSTKSDKGAAKPRGSSSPFKCIGLGLVQQMNSEKDELQRGVKQFLHLFQIFMLNTRLAQAESMTHDVIRDLLGVKLDMTDQEAIKLRKELNEFIQERQSWLHEIKLRHTEMVDARMMAEKLRQREQFISTENEMLKEENTLLKIENEDLNVRLRRSEEVLLRVKEELARYRLSFGKDPCIDFDKEEQLRMKLQVAGLTDPTTNISPSAAEDAAYRLKDRINSLENEIEDLKLKCKLLHENIRLYEIRQQLSPQQPKTNDNFLSS